MLIIGLTGGIGSGKTVVSDHFKSLGINVVDADVVSRVVVEPGRPALQQIADRHGADILLEDGSLDRRKLRDIVFNNPEEKKWLESLLHPLIGIETAQQLQASTSPYTIFVSPLLLEIGQYKMTQRVLVVDVPESIQLERTSLRDSTTPENVQAIMDTQSKRQDRTDRADDVILNDGDIPSLLKKVDALHQQYLELAAMKA